MSQPNQQPDLDDSINVAEAHGRVVRDAAACAREKRIVDNGREPISLWAITVCGVATLFAGGILGAAGNLFSYDSFVKESYVRTAPPGAGNEGPSTKTALEAYAKRGAKIYGVKCNGCHGADAKGDGANYPSLVGSEWVLGDTQRFAMIILNGLQGATSTGKAYPALMPAQAVGLEAEDLAGIMTYVRNGFGNSTGDVVTVEMAKAAMEVSANRSKAGAPTDAAELNSAHAKALPGDPIDPALMVDPISLKPAEEEETAP